MIWLNSKLHNSLKSSNKELTDKLQKIYCDKMGVFKLKEEYNNNDKTYLYHKEKCVSVCGVDL